MDNFRKVFNEGLNADDDFSVIGKGQWVNASGIRTFTTDKGATGRVEAVNGTAVVFNTLPINDNHTIGAVADEARKRILFFNWNENDDHAIYCYDKLADTTYIVILDSQVTGGLAFNKRMRIDSNAKVLGDLLTFTDFNNEPRKINIEAGIKLNQSGYVTPELPYADPLAYTTLTVIKRPPIYPLSLTKFDVAGSIGNLTKNNAYQITYRYIYRDNETSALASYGQLIPYNSPAEDYNSVLISLSFQENIDDDIQQIDICVKRGNAGKTEVVKSWNKNDVADAAAIAAHNANTTALGFTYFDDKKGTILDAVTSITSFDNVPLLTKSIEQAKDRQFHGHILTGYDTPVPTSLALTLGSYDTGAGGSFTAQWKTFALTIYNPSVGYGTMEFYYAYTTALANTAWFYSADQTTTAPVTLNSIDATNSFPTENGLASWIQSGTLYPPPSGYHYVYGPVTFFDVVGQTTDLIFAVNLNGLQFFKSGSTYKASIAFYDRFRRKCGVVAKDIYITTPLRTADQTVFAGNILWSLSNTDALNEIPDWAYYYQIHISKNFTTRFFVQFQIADTDYIVKNQDGTYDYGNPSFVLNTTYATGFDLTPLTSAGLGYTFTEGDQLRVFKTDGTNVLLDVLGTDGNFVFASAEDLGTLGTGVEFLIELYTPYKPTVNEGLFETGGVFNVINPGQDTRTYETLSGSINGDCYAIERDAGGSDLYFCEAMSPNDKFWQDWETDTGWVNAIDTIGQKLLKDAIVFSDTYIEGTKVNGFNKFQPLNEQDLGSDNGAIQKLQLASKVQLDGTVMLALCDLECVSMYLGEQELVDTQGSAFVAKANNVIGSFKALKGSMGTSNPESVFEYNGLVFWWDTRNGCAVQYANNGLFAISKKKFVRAANLFSKKFSSMSVADIEALGGQPFIIGGFDPYHKEVLFTIPSTESTPPKGYLEDYSSPQIVYPYDIYDGIGKTLVYTHEQDQWRGSDPYQAEMFVKMDNDLYSFKAGALYIHNQTSVAPCQFYGVQNTAKLMYSGNPGAIHTFESIGLESNKTPVFIHFRTEDPFTQSSDLPYPGARDLISKQGVIESSLLRDRLSPNATGSYDVKELTGDKLYGKALLIMLEWEFVTDPTLLELRVSDLGFVTNTGTIINKQS